MDVRSRPVEQVDVGHSPSLIDKGMETGEKDLVGKNIKKKKSF